MIDVLLTGNDLERIRKGVYIGYAEKTQGAKIKLLNETNNATLIRITLSQGKNGKSEEYLNTLEKVIRLLRTQFVPCRLGNLLPIQWKEVSSPATLLYDGDKKTRAVCQGNG